MKWILSFTLVLYLSQVHAHAADCSQADPKQCYEIGLKQAEEGKHDTAKASFKAACDLKNQDACAYYGVYLIQESENGWFQGKKKQEAIALFKSSCDLGSGLGCLNYGFSLHNQGTDQSYEEAKNYYKKGCDLGAGDACYEYGKRLSFREGQDHIVYFKKACETDALLGCVELAKTQSNVEISNLESKLERACNTFKRPENKTPACEALASYRKVASEKQLKIKSEEQGIISHVQLHRMANVGMKIGKTYWVTSRVSKVGNGLVNPDLKGDHLLIQVSTDTLTTEQKGAFYDLRSGSEDSRGYRGQIGCFGVALMANGTFELTGVKSGPCKVN